MPQKRSPLKILGMLLIMAVAFSWSAYRMDQVLGLGWISGVDQCAGVTAQDCKLLTDAADRLAASQ